MLNRDAHDPHTSKAQRFVSYALCLIGAGVTYYGAEGLVILLSPSGQNSLTAFKNKDWEAAFWVLLSGATLLFGLVLLAVGIARLKR